MVTAAADFPWDDAEDELDSFVLNAGRGRGIGCSGKPLSESTDAPRA